MPSAGLFRKWPFLLRKMAENIFYEIAEGAGVSQFAQRGKISPGRLKNELVGATGFEPAKNTCFIGKFKG